MKTEIELNIDQDGKQCIKFKHYDKSGSLEQKSLGLFIDAVKKHGCELVNPSGYKDTNGNSWENYEIRIRK